MMRTIVVCTALVAAPALAGTTTGMMPVSLRVEPACRVEASALAFAGPAGHTMDAQSPVSILCTTETNVSVSLDNGRNARGGTRQLADGAGRLVPYAIYADAAHSRLWSAAAAPVAGTVGSGGEWRLTAFGRVEGADAMVAGTYHDTVTVTVSF
jgi:spore coat protein U-like protein